MIALLLPLLLSPAPAARAEDEPAPRDVVLDGNAHKHYLLHTPPEGAQEPADGWRLLVVMPGGDGSADFAPFVGRIRSNALDERWLVAQIVAPVWSADQAESNVWPTKRNPWPKMEFACEELFAAVVADVGKQHKLDPRFLFTLAWSSSGTLAYTLGVAEKTPVTGTFVAMSVFKPDLLPSLKGAKGQRFYILHSPEDFIPIAMAEQARDELDQRGAEVRYATYAGGHGWHGDVFGMLKTGLGWLAGEAKDRKPPKAAKASEK